MLSQAFFERWWRQQSNAKKVKVKKLVDSGQLEFMCVFFGLTFFVLFLVSCMYLDMWLLQKWWNVYAR